MLELDSTLAQHIVDRAMAILPHNINVMDAQGMIIGSGDPSRLHTRHEGAQLVLANPAWWRSTPRPPPACAASNPGSICRCCMVNG